MSSTGSSTPRPRDADEALEQLGRMTLRDQSMEAVLQTVSDLAKAVLPGDPETSVLLLERDRPTTVALSGELALRLDERQYDLGQGPCLHAATTLELTEIPDTRTEQRWSDYVRGAVTAGNLSSLSVPLVVAEGVSGALNIYAREPNAFDDEARAAATRFAPYAAVALANMHAYQGARTLADNLTAALESRAVIDQAKGILMERLKLTADQAFQALSTVSMHSNTKVRDIADHLVRTGEFPPGGSHLTGRGGSSARDRRLRGRG
jgi:GAF domain-containing protein